MLCDPASTGFASFAGACPLFEAACLHRILLASPPRKTTLKNAKYLVALAPPRARSKSSCSSRELGRLPGATGAPLGAP